MPTARMLQTTFLVAGFAAGLATGGPACASDEAPTVKPGAVAEPKSEVPSRPTTAGGTPAEVLDQSAVQGIIGRTVKSATGEDMGRIVDFLVSPTGDVRAAVLDFGGVLGVGSRRVAVSWKALSFANVAKEGFVEVKLTRNQIRVAPEMKAGDPIVVLEPPPEVPAKPPAHAAASPPQNSAPQAVAPHIPAPQKAVPQRIAPNAPVPAGAPGQPAAAPAPQPAGVPETKK